MIDEEDDLEIAIQQLGIKARESANDRQELYRILFDVLGYPMVEEALLHEKANLLGENDLIKAQEIIQRQIRNKQVSRLKVCRCCGILQQNDSLEYCTSLKDVNIGVGVKLYFMSLSYHAVLFTIATLLYSIYSITTNVSFANSDSAFLNTNCLLNGTCGIAIIGLGPKATNATNQSRDSVFIQLIISIAMIIIWGIINIYRMHSQKLVEVENDLKRSSASDFTLLIENFPKIYLNKSKHEIEKQFNRIFKQYEKITNTTLSYQVVKVNIGRPLYNQITKQYEHQQLLLKELEQMQNAFRNMINHRRRYRQFNQSEEQRELYYEKYIKFYIQKFDRKSTQLVQLEDKCTVFVTLRSSKARQQIARLNEPSSIFNLFNICQSKYEFPVKGVVINNAPQPQEIMWQNIGFTKCQKLSRRMLIYFVAFCLISLSLGISVILGKIQTSQKEMYMSIIISIVITIINFIIEYIIQAISFLENEFNKTSQQASIALKIGVSQLVNSVGVPIAVAYIADKKVYQSGGLVTDIFFLGLFNIATPIGRFIDPFYLYLNIKQVYYSTPEQRLKMFGQEKLNKHYANYEMELGYEYSYIIRTVIFTSFFMCLQPIIAIFAPIGLGLMYLVNKYRIYYRFYRPKFHNFHVNDIINWMLALGPVGFSLGHLYCLFWVKQTVVSSTSIQIALWVELAISCFLIIFCFKIFYSCVQQPAFPEQDYYDKKPVLMSDYDLLNPVTKQQAISQMEDYFRQLEHVQNLPNRWELLKLSLFESSIQTNRMASLKNKLSDISKNMSIRVSKDIKNKNQHNLTKDIINPKRQIAMELNEGRVSENSLRGDHPNYRNDIQQYKNDIKPPFN